jgi:oxygen-independent coproporphyrinogen III oxidase
VRPHRRDSAALSIVYFEVRPRHLYVHVPFCARRCAYCDFSIAVRRVVPGDEYVDALGRELALRFPERLMLDTLYFGGGTPSRLGGEGVAKMMEMVRERVDLAADAELTLEANPDDIDEAAATLWRQAGINRLSIGAQSFDDDVLSWMHRVHDAAMIGGAVSDARAAGFENYSLDLIFALPREIERDWERDVACALALEPAHLSLYGLTIEPHTPLGRQEARGQFSSAPEERYEREFLHAHEAVTAAGLEHYEVSNFGRPGTHSRHNSAYWSGVAYVGVGPAAHEFDARTRRWNVGPYAEWARRVVAGNDPIGGSETLTDESRVAEEVYLGLRTRQGLQLSGSEVTRVARWVDAGWATLDNGDRVVLTPLGWLRLDALAADLTHVRSRY